MTATTRHSAASQLGGLSSAVFIGTLAIGVPMSVLPQHVHGALGYGTVVVGIVVGMQSAVTLLTRAYASTISDTHGPKRAVLAGLVVCSTVGWGYLAAALLEGPAALVALLAGRALLGLGESLLITGSMAQGVARMGPARAGMAIVWIGVAMYAAYGLGAPVGDATYRGWGFASIAVAVILLPLLGLGFAAQEVRIPPMPKRPAPFGTVLRWMLPAGAGLAFSAVGYSAIAAFLPLMLLARGWGGAGLVMTAFAAGFIVARLFFGGWPDRYGGRNVALASLAVECIGQILLWQAPSLVVAAMGGGLATPSPSPAWGSRRCARFRRRTGAWRWDCMSPSSMWRWASVVRFWELWWTSRATTLPTPRGPSPAAWAFSPRYGCHPGRPSHNECLARGRRWLPRPVTRRSCRPHARPPAVA